MISSQIKQLSLKDISCLLFTLEQSLQAQPNRRASIRLDKIKTYVNGDSFYILINDLRIKSSAGNDCYQAFCFPEHKQRLYLDYPFNLEAKCAIIRVCQRRFYSVGEFSQYKEIINSNYKLFYLSPEHERQSQWVLINNNRYDSYFLFERLESKPAFSQRDNELIALLLPHISLYLHSFQGQKQNVSLVDLYQGILDCSDKGLAVCNKHAHPVVINKTLMQHLQQSSKLSITQNYLRLQENLLCKQFHDYINLCCNPNTKEPLSIEWHDEQQGVGITIRPLNIHYQQHGPVCLVVFDYQQKLNWGVITKEYQLTCKELALVQAIYQQRSLHQIAQNEQVSYHTLRSHLQHVFKKMGVHGQAQVVAKINLFKGL
jgi:DNA-binding CsgD family transcriptional regulator